MNPSQMAQQLRKVLRAATWPSGGDVVFGDQVFVVSEDLPSEENLPRGFPFALVVVGDGEPDEDHSDLIEQTFTVLVAVNVAGDDVGEHAIIGGARPDLAESAGAGSEEVAERARDAVFDLTGADGARVRATGTGIGGTSPLGGGKHLAVSSLTVTALCASALTYAAPQQLAESSDVWTWTGPHCSDRFDFFRYRLGRKAGSTPPETPADADAIVYTGTAATTTHTPVAGQAYAIFADYDGRGQGAVEGSSSGSEVGAFLTT